MDETHVLTFWKNFNSLVRRTDTRQDIVADKAGISVNTLRGWISKDILPRADIAVALAKALGVTVEYLFTGKESLEIPKDVLDTAFEINALPPQFKSIVLATLQSCKEQCLAQEGAKALDA